MKNFISVRNITAMAGLLLAVAACQTTVGDWTILNQSADKTVMHWAGAGQPDVQGFKDAKELGAAHCTKIGKKFGRPLAAFNVGGYESVSVPVVTVPCVDANLGRRFNSASVAQHPGSPARCGAGSAASGCR